MSDRPEAYIALLNFDRLPMTLCGEHFARALVARAVVDYAAVFDNPTTQLPPAQCDACKLLERAAKLEREQAEQGEWAEPKITNGERVGLTDSRATVTVGGSTFVVVGVDPGVGVSYSRVFISSTHNRMPIVRLDT